MADQSDVEEALVSVVSATLYPSGTSEPSVPGPDCRIYRGWPNSAALDADLAAGKINVTVFPGSGMGRTTTRFMGQSVGSPAQPTLTYVVVGTSVTFGGSAGVGQIAGILADGFSYVYRTQPGDTPDLVAASLAAMARSHFIVLLSHDTLTVAGVGKLSARVVADASVRQEIRRQEQSFRITCWCPTPATRDATAAAIDQALSGIHFVALADETSARLVYIGTTVFDQSQNARLYRRDLNYSAEYATILTSSLPAMLFGDLGVNAARFTA
ncbi:MAG TPA: hypothetical protein VHT74_06225 [Acetobacteraceae bacterium]|jgi:hypothetical protein|nr:hypothetical protein [Acetobacteraceae bacterium]